MSFRDSSPDLSGAAAGFPGPADCHDGRSYGCIRDPTTADTASWHHFGQASDSSATAQRASKSVQGAASATRSELAVLDSPAPGLARCDLFWF
jgi:hypothetical protein